MLGTLPHLQVERFDVGVWINDDVGARQARSIDQAGMVEAVRKDHVAGAGQRGYHPEVGHVAGREMQRAR